MASVVVIGSHRSLSATRRKAMTKRKWTKTDLRTMKAMAGKSKAWVIARKLRRTESAVVQKAHMIGMSLSTW
jgi:hypothetical protein